jgi:hypothetical protein
MRDGKILNLFQDMGGLQMRRKSLYSQPVINFYQNYMAFLEQEMRVLQQGNKL